ncbi:Aste57867_8380 [Aphanomyces stellatus]|uniref:Aste57867_8380 protein n=1 Tax=Aphanomyces stellatus TaxID=120398 RepID=A0A485KK98_9STRA|nr:hypothetical protein As57867_008348 [Aphanomyces stellatus]VFT85266.1 Aste57867_8380 [Aphanomyces stellatus]
MDLPLGCKAIGVRWVFARKTDSKDNVVRYNARLVVKGYSQLAGIDFKETYSPVVKMNSIRAIIALIAFKHWIALQGDADTTFAQAMMEKGIFIFVDQPSGFSDGTTRRMLLLKALYGLKQAALA